MSGLIAPTGIHNIGRVSTILDSPLASIAERVRLERESRGWTLADVAARSGVSRAMISKVERCEAVACGDADFTVIAVNLKGENYLAWNFYNDTDVQPGATYAYRVRAFNSAGQSAPSNAASATACFVDTDWEGGGYYICVDP